MLAAMVGLGHRAWRMVALVAVACGVLFGVSEWRVRRAYDVPLRALPPLPTDAAAIDGGGRLARVLGCGSCHGADLAGAVVAEAGGLARLVAPNLTRRVPTYTDAELARAIRHGIARDGRALWAMPAQAYVHLADDDVRRLVAWLRRRPAGDGVEDSTSLGLLGRWMVVTGDLGPPAATLDHAQTRLPTDGDVVTRGRYLAHVACGECHGATLQGGLSGKAPPLAIGAAYTDEAFRTLLRTGRTPGERDLYLMDDAARERFAELTDEEIDALHAYTRGLAEGRER